MLILIDCNRFDIPHDRVEDLLLSKSTYVKTVAAIAAGQIEKYTNQPDEL